RSCCRIFRRWSARTCLITGLAGLAITSPWTDCVAGAKRTLGLCRDRVPGDLDEGGEAFLVANREISENLAVDRHTRGGQAVDERAVGHAVQTGGGVDPLDPQPAHVTLAIAAIAVGVLQRAHQRLVRALVEAIA